MLDQAKQSWGFDGYVRLWWVDPRLAFNASTLGCAETLKLSVSEVQRVWTPTLYWEGLAKDGVQLPRPYDSQGMLFEVRPNGSVWWSRQVSFELACPMDLARMPYDVQTCPLVMGLYDATSDEVSLRWRAGAAPIESSASAGIAPEGWSLPVMAEAARQIAYGGEAYSYATAAFSFQRLPAMYLASYALPTVASVAIASCGFYIQQGATMLHGPTLRTVP